MKKNRRLVPLVLILLLLAAAGIVVLLLIGDNTEIPVQVETQTEETGLLTVDGVTYRPRSRLTTILLMGIDPPRDDGAATTPNRRGGQADFLRLVVIDAAAHTVTQIPIDRDTIASITTLTVTGKRAGKRSTQICLAHSYGDGAELSAQLTTEAVSGLLLGVPVDHYMALQMDGIPALNDWVGGVTVTLEDDFSQVDPAMVPGATLKLTGEQAENYLHGRMTIGDGTNASRMRRQQTYISALSDLLLARFRKSQNAAGELYDSLQSWMLTDFSRGRMINEVWAARNYSQLTLTLPGVSSENERGYNEFHPDSEALERVVLQVFYEPVS